MQSTLDRLNYSALKFNEDIASFIEDICQPLFNNFGITNFGYVKIDSSGSMLRISTGPKWTRRYFEQQYYNDTDFYFFDDVAENSSRIRIYTNQPNGGVFSELYDYNIWNIYTIYERNLNFAEVWFFATSRDKSSMIDFYINNQDVLENFIQYFKQNTASLILTAKPEAFITTKLKIHTMQNAEEQKIRKFLQDIGQHNHPNKFKFTNREKDCIQHLIMGRTAKEIARQLLLSPRTVEHHIESVKRKVGCNRVHQLLRILINEGKRYGADGTTTD